MHANEQRAAVSEWDTAAAVALMVETDALVEALGVSGSDPEITVCAGEVVAAHTRRDMASVKMACHLIRERARALANQTPTGSVA